jgi:2,3-bisphosphoglycerate-independent phosphoglycerate mutase
MKAHSWHPIPLLIRSPLAFVDDCTAFHEQETIRGHLGDLRSHELMGMLLAHAGRLAKFGA